MYEIELYSTFRRHNISLTEIIDIGIIFQITENKISYLNKIYSNHRACGRQCSFYNLETLTNKLFCNIICPCIISRVLAYKLLPNLLFLGVTTNRLLIAKRY